MTSRADNKSQPRLTTGPVPSTLLRLTAPMLVAMLGMVGFNIADTYFVARLGTESLAAISFTFPVVFVIASIALGLGVGTGAVLSRTIGRGDHERARRLTTHALVLSLGIVLLVVALGLSTIEPLFSALGAPPHLVTLISEYMRLWYLGMPFLVIPMVGNGAIRATGDTRTPATIMLVATGANLALDPLLILGVGSFDGWGLKGAALATVGSRAITLAAALYILIKRERLLGFERTPLSDVWASWRDILYIGLPAALTNLIVPASMALVTRLVASFGVTAVAGFGVATRLEMIPLMLINALGSVLVPFVGQNWGANRLDRVRQAVRVSHVFGLVVGALALGLFWAFGAPLARLFDDHPEVVSTVVTYGKVVGISWGLQGLVVLSSAAFNALNQPLPSAALSLLRMVVLYLPLAWLLSHWWGLVGIFVAATVASAVAGGVAIWWVRTALTQLSHSTDAASIPDSPDAEPRSPQLDS